LTPLFVTSCTSPPDNCQDTIDAYKAAETILANGRARGLALRVLLGDRPLQMAARLNRQSAAARLTRARRALAGRRATRQTPAS
jgi:hypothetical protein